MACQRIEASTERGSEATITRSRVISLESPARTDDRVLVLGDLALVAGGAPPRPADGSLAAQILQQSSRLTDRGLHVDVGWDLLASLESTAGLAATGRLGAYRAVVIAAPTGQAAHVERGLTALVAAGRSHPMTMPALTVLLVSPAADRDLERAAKALADLHAAVRDLGAETRVSVLPAQSDDRGVLAHPQLVATAILVGLRESGGRAEPDPLDEISEVAVDHSLAALRGRTGDLRRALILAQNSFDTPFAQLNLVSRGTLRSLAYIGRSSDGLQQSLSAEAFRGGRPLLIGDTRAVDRFTQIPETHGPDAIRYYLGHPVRDDAGRRIGVLCVLDVEPHQVVAGDDDLIRDVALLVEGELAALLTTPR